MGLNGQLITCREGLGQRVTMDGQLALQGSQVAADGTCKLLFALRVSSSSVGTFGPGRASRAQCGQQNM